jgi:hypothetical protein
VTEVSNAIRFGLSGVFVVAVGRTAAAGRLPKNLLVGIRIPSTLRSDAAWRAGHLAAASSLTASGVGPIAVATIVGVTRPGSRAQAVLFGIGTAWLLGWVARATLLARRAALA